MSEAGDKLQEAVLRSRRTSNEQREAAAADVTAVSLSGDTAVAVEFLQSWPGYPVLSASHTELATGKKGLFETKSFPPPTDWNAVAKWIDDRQSKANLYFSVNPPLHAIDKKSEKANIARIDALHVDSDVRPRENQEEGTARIIAMFESYKVPPSLIISSGGGAQAFWILETPFEINGDITKAAEAECLNRQLERDNQGDNCFNVDRIMRLPGTINIPNATKIRKGRKPALARVHSYPGTKYPLSAFTMAEPLGGKPEDAESGSTVALSGKYERMAPNDERLKALGQVWSTFGFTGDTENRYGGDRSKALFAFVCQAVRAGIADDIIASCIMDPDWKIGECVREKKNVKREIGRVIERAHLFATNSDLAEMNERHAAGSVNGKFRVITWKPDKMFPLQRVAEFQSHDDFCATVVNPRIEFEGKDHKGNPQTIRAPRGKWWIAQDRRAEFDGIDFRPGSPQPIELFDHDGRPIKLLNMYSGFSVEPDFDDSETKCSAYLAHIRDNIAGGDETTLNYILDWMASGVQHPGNPARSALSLRGVPGAGKGVFALEYGNLFGCHFLHITQREQVTGRFNALSAKACLVFVDEALYSGILADARILKTIISERTKILGYKGIDSVQVRNFARYIFSTNDLHPLNIEHNDRRYCAIYVLENPLWADEQDDDKKADIRAGYFRPLLDQMKNGGRAALLGYLLRRDITNFNPERIPNNAERGVQKMLSAPAGDKVVIGFAQDGHLPGALSAKRPHIARANGIGCLYPAMRERGGRALAHETEVALADIIKAWGFTRHPLGDGAGWKAPPLLDLRAAINAKYAGSIEWDAFTKDWRADVAAEREVDDAEIPF